MENIEEEDLLEEDESLGPIQIYGTIGEPSYNDTMGKWTLEMVFFEEGAQDKSGMHKGYMNSATREGLERVQKHFRTSVVPLTGEDLATIFEEEKAKKYLRQH